MSQSVNLTKLQLDEISHKLGIVADETDLQESYDITAATAEAWRDYFYAAKPGQVVIPDGAAELLIGELENCCEIADGNLECGDLSFLSYRTSMRNAIKKLKEATQ